MRKNTLKKNIKKISKKAVKNPEVTVATTAVVSGFAIFGAIETGIIIKNKAKAKIAEIKEKKENKKNKDNTNNNSNDNSNDNSAATEPQQPVAEDEVKNNNEGAEA